MEARECGYCYVCGHWRDLNDAAMCTGCYDWWRVEYYHKPAAIMARCDIS